MKDQILVTEYSWATHYAIRRENIATITVDLNVDATPGQLDAVVRRIREDRGWTA